MKLPDITTGEVEKAICQLANGKASDHLGMTAEHYKIGGNIVSKYIAGILNTVLSKILETVVKKHIVPTLSQLKTRCNEDLLQRLLQPMQK